MHDGVRDQAISEETATWPSPRRRVVHAAAFSVGALLAAAAGALNLTVTTKPIPADAIVSMEASTSGNMNVSPAGVLASDTALAPGEDGLRGAVTVTNHTARPAHVTLRAEVGDGTLDDQLIVRATAGGAEVFHGPLAELRLGRAESFLLESGAATAVDVSASFPISLAEGYQGVEETVRLTFDARPER